MGEGNRRTVFEWSLEEFENDGHPDTVEENTEVIDWWDQLDNHPQLNDKYLTTVWTLILPACRSDLEFDTNQEGE